ncbi:uncharacterized protein LOC122577429 isoform X4 [Bombus pyrosoma]|uniref:uncharacterized protein LOC122577429 isoform X1 n=1 Tax=Bombus pyrosoma TaxID=396416 RepID=UPI001CB984F5|nr:uncharacterized protein LOC122577429 isoform X1 [Bombus pyrosoma]XP_043604663.1 uncharacterized protein LOC122577429 isoform X2 [Bombus pyrosoma]XP_043604664.1 uncharacterized protein LOC122577429 isoform X3 [Bombus pyrosoma]XP_043604665.1 uncharacterized protein LOC122577429 isoform X4 [Bombus pyrosoma]
MAVTRDSSQALSEILKAWDANFRAMNTKLHELQDDMRLIKIKQEPVTPISPTIIQGETIPTQSIKLKDAIESVPVFDGHRPSVFQFLRACERARKMIPKHQEPQLVKLLTNKLRGHAFLAVEDTELVSLNDFGNKLKDMFGPGKTVNEYKGELATVLQRPGEDILDYIDRVRNLRLAIMDGERYEYGTIFQDRIDRDTREAFVKGLPNEVYLRVKIAGYESLDDAYRQAVRATRELKRASNRMRYQRSTPPINYNRNNARPQYNSNYIGNNHQHRRFVPPSRNRLNDPDIEEDVWKRARAITWEEKCVSKYPDRNSSQKRDADHLKQPTSQYKHCSIAVIKDNVTLNNKRTHGTTDRITSEKSSEFPIKINNINTKELSEEAEIRKLNDETIGNAYPSPNITEILESLNCDKDQTTKNKSIAIPIPKTESVSRKVSNKNSKNNSKSIENILKRLIQINNNLNMISTSNENIHSEKVEENQQVYNNKNKVNKEGKGVTEGKNSKHSLAEKTQVERAQRNQEEENRESSVEDLYKNSNKYASHWITIGLKIFYWLLHLVFNINSINADLVTPLGKYRWYYTILHSKYLWVNIAMTFSKFSILNAISNRLNNWLSDGKLVFWRKIKTKMKKRKKIVIGYMVVLKPISQSIAAPKGNEYVSTIQDLHEETQFSPHELNLGHLTREPTGKVIIKEDMESTYAKYLGDMFDKINTVQQTARENSITSKMKPEEYYYRRINSQNSKVGYLVYPIKEPSKGKFPCQYTGPHKVLENLQNQNVKIKVNEVPRTVHLSKLKLAHNRNNNKLNNFKATQCSSV